MKSLFVLLIVLQYQCMSHTVLAQDLDFQEDSEDATVETIEQKDGKHIRKIRSGKVRNRKGGPKVGEIEEGEVKKYKRRHETLSFTTLGFGPYGSSNVGDKKLLYGFSYGRIWETSDTWDIRADIFGAVNGEGGYTAIGLGSDFIFSSSDISPFIGAQLGFGYADGNDKNEGGFSGQANLGLRMFRLADTQMEILGSYATVFGGESLGVYGIQLRVLF